MVVRRLLFSRRVESPDVERGLAVPFQYAKRSRCRVLERRTGVIQSLR